jgi:Arc/MetJ-type ribon-helix-helix transcriptional regulator
MIPEYKERVAIRLSPEQKKGVQHLVDVGLYKNASEVVRDALTRLLKEIAHE